jgi:hypothetical protein
MVKYMKYTIPTIYLDKLTKKINHIKNKGGNITFNVGSERKQEIYLHHVDQAIGHEYKDTFPTYIKVVDIEVEGKYIVNGWEFIASIEHTASGNIVRAINNNYKIPDKYYTCGPACEHCHIVRDRKDTYLVYNKEKDEWKQVGKTCLQDFTGGLDAEVCAAYVDIETYISQCENLENYENDDGFGWNSDNSFSGDFVKKIGYTLIKKYGYVKLNNDTNSIASVTQLLHEYKHDEFSLSIEPASNEDIEKINVWVEDKNKILTKDYSDNQYLYNAIIAWKKEYPEYRDLALILSLIATYFKDIQEQTKNKDKQVVGYVGNIGDKIKFKVESYRFLYEKNNSIYGRYATPTSIYQVNDDKGNVFIVETTTENIDDSWVGKTIEGKVKAQREYKGIKQTIVNRIKLLSESMSIYEALKALKA